MDNITHIFFMTINHNIPVSRSLEECCIVMHWHVGKLHNSSTSMLKWDSHIQTYPSFLFFINSFPSWSSSGLGHHGKDCKWGRGMSAVQEARIGSVWHVWCTPEAWSVTGHVSLSQAWWVALHSVKSIHMRNVLCTSHISAMTYKTGTSICMITCHNLERKPKDKAC